MENTCTHDFVYSGEFFATNPPKYFGICRLCGENELHIGKPDTAFDRATCSYLMLKFNYYNSPNSVGYLINSDKKAKVDGETFTEDMIQFHNFSLGILENKRKGVKEVPIDAYIELIDRYADALYSAEHYYKNFCELFEIYKEQGKSSK